MPGALNIALPKSGKLLSVNAEATTDGYTYSFVLLQRKGQKLDTAKSGSGYDSIESLKKAANSSAPVVLTLTGRRVLFKTLDGEIHEEVTLLQSVLPNASFNDFYLQYGHGKGKTLASVVRKDHLDELLESFKAQSLLVQEVYFGPFVLANLQLVAGANPLDLGPYIITFADQQLENWQRVPEGKYRTMKIGEEQIEGDCILPFAAAFGTWFPQLEFSHPDSEMLDWQSKELKRRSRFRTVGGSALAVLFVVLLVNFMLNGQYKEELAELKYQESVNRSQLDEIDFLQAQLDHKKSVLNASGVLSTGSLAFYSDRLAETVPENIVLLRLGLLVPTEGVKQDKRITYASRTMVISGETDEGATLNDWLNTLNREPWISNTDLEVYEKDDRSGMANFKVNLILK